MSDTRLYLNKKRKIDTEIKDQKSSLIEFLYFEKKASKTPFDKHVDVSRQIIFPMLRLEDNGSLIRTSQNLNQLFSKPFDKVLFTLKPMHQRLLEHVIHGEEKEVKAIIEKYPILLLYKGKVTDYSGRKIKGTPYQMALGAEDIEMAEMIQGYLAQLPGGLAEIMRQQKQQFPDDEKEKQAQSYNHILMLKAGAKIEDELKDTDQNNTIAIELRNKQLTAFWIEDGKRKQKTFPAKQVSFILSKLPQPGKISKDEELINDITLEYECARSKELRALFAITKSIRDAKEGEITKDADSHLKIRRRHQAELDQFRSSLEPTPKKVIMQGKHFNAELLLMALKLYGRYYHTFGGYWNSPKNILFWRQVIGYIQRFLPTCYAQAFCQGLCFVKNGEKLRRSLEFRYESGIFIFPLDSDPHFRLGYEYGAPAWGGETGKPGGEVVACGGELFEAYVKTKTAGLQNLCNTQTLNRRMYVS